MTHAVAFVGSDGSSVVRVKEYAPISTKVIATCFALMGFASSLVVGAAAGNPAMTVIYRSLVGMVICYFVGTLVALVGNRAVKQSVLHYKQTHAIPTEGSSTSESVSGAHDDSDPHASSTVGSIAQESQSPDTSRSAA